MSPDRWSLYPVPRCSQHSRRRKQACRICRLSHVVRGTVIGSIFCGLSDVTPRAVRRGLLCLGLEKSENEKIRRQRLKQCYDSCLARVAIVGTNTASSPHERSSDVCSCDVCARILVSYLYSAETRRKTQGRGERSDPLMRRSVKQNGAESDSHRTNEWA